MTSAVGRESLLPRIRGLFVVLVVLFLGIELVEWLDAETPLVPQRVVAAISLGLALGWLAVVHRRARPDLLLDTALPLIVLGVGWGLGRPNAVVAMLVGVLQLRSLYGSRRSVAAATAAVLGAYVAIAVLTEGWQAVPELGTLVVVLGCAALALVFRLVGEALAAHDLAAAWDAALTEAAGDLLVATSVEDVDAVASRALSQVRRVAEWAAGDGLWSDAVRPDDVPATPYELERAIRQGEYAAPGTDLARTLRRLGADVALARDRIDTQQRFRVLADNSREGIYVLELHPEPRFRYLNPAAERLLGRSASAVYEDARSALEQVHPEDRALAGFTPKATVVEDPVRIRIVRGQDDVVWVEIQETVLERRGDEPTAVQGVARDITRQWEEEVSLRRALEQEAAVAAELRALDEMKSTFLRAVSHELRTPLTAVLGSATTLRRLYAELSPQHVDQLLGAIDRQATRLSRLLEDLLDVDRLSRGLVEPEREPVELLSLARSVVDAAAAESRPVAVEGAPVTVELDGPKVERIIDNLVRNANKHTPEGTSIRIEVGRDDAGAVLTVEDDGPGVPPGLHAELFEPFAQGPSAHAAAASPGTGIGLALVSKLAELHDGRAWVEDRPGGGARFVVTLPGRVVEPHPGSSQPALH